ncbi:MAG: hypothetical protein QXO70_03950 [Candidatus Pacearchaeota archaeon]
MRYKLYAINEEGLVVPKYTRRNSSEKIILKIKEKMEKQHPELIWRIKAM